MRSTPPRHREITHAELLHNMSCRPRTNIKHAPPQGHTYGRRQVFQLPEHLLPVRSASDWLKELGYRRRKGRAEPTEAELRQRINEHATTLDLPPAAAVLDTARPGDTACGNLLTILTVLSKSSRHVYLRDKVPNLANLTPNQRVVLVIPPESSVS